MSTHADSMAWIVAQFGTHPPVKRRQELVRSLNERRALAKEIRSLANYARGQVRHEALRTRAFLLELEESPSAAAGLLAEAEALGVEVVA